MKEPKVREVIEWLRELCLGKHESKTLATQRLEALPTGYFEDHSVPKTKVKDFIHALPEVILTTNSNDIKQWAAQMIGELHLKSAEATKALQYCLAEEAETVLCSAIWAIGETRITTDLIASLVLQALHPAQEVRWRIAWALYSADKLPSGVGDTLIKMLDDDYHTCRGYALLALDKHFALDQKIIRKIKTMTEDIDVMPRLAALDIIAKHENHSV